MRTTLPGPHRPAQQPARRSAGISSGAQRPAAPRDAALPQRQRRPHSPRRCPHSSPCRCPCHLHAATPPRPSPGHRALQPPSVEPARSAHCLPSALPSVGQLRRSQFPARTWPPWCSSRRKCMQQARGSPATAQAFLQQPLLRKVTPLELSRSERPLGFGLPHTQAPQMHAASALPAQ